MNVIITLLILYQVKHFICDFPLQTRFMLGKFKSGNEFLFPLLTHACVHLLGTLLITVWFVDFDTALAFGLFDFVIHAVMDRIKASPKMLGRFKSLTPDTISSATEKQWRHNNYFWWSLGFDQMIHHFTHYAIIWWIVTRV